jgi:hypothetical protein
VCLMMKYAYIGTGHVADGRRLSFRLTGDNDPLISWLLASGVNLVLADKIIHP